MAKEEEGVTKKWVSRQGVIGAPQGLQDKGTEEGRTAADSE